jgi:hypothetical protein
MTEAISLLEKWYLAQCNGDWEHQWGVKIDTLDNPGWTLEIDLNDTRAESRQLERIKVERSGNDWFLYSVEKKKFKASMGPGNLGEVIRIFCDWFDETS